MDRVMVARIVLATLAVVTIMQMVAITVTNENQAQDIRELIRQQTKRRVKEEKTGGREKRSLGGGGKRGRGGKREVDQTKRAFISLRVDTSNSSGCLSNYSTRNPLFEISRKPNPRQLRREYFRYRKKNNRVIVRKDGLYLIHGQILFVKPDVISAFSIFVNAGETPHITCVTSSHSPPFPASDDATRQVFAQVEQCNLRGVIRLQAGDNVSGKFNTTTPISCKEHLSFWGIVTIL